MKTATSELPEDALGELLKAVRFHGSVFCRASLRAPWGFGVRARAFATFHFVASGRCWFNLTGSTKRTHLAAGDLVVLPRGDAHEVRDASTSSCMWLEELVAGSRRTTGTGIETTGRGAKTLLVCGGFESPGVQDVVLLASLPRVIHLRRGRGRAARWVGLALRVLGEEAGRQRGGGDAVMARLAELVFIEAVRTHLSVSSANSPPLVAALRDPGISDVLMAIQRQPAAAWTLSTLAQRAMMSRTAFASRFRMLLGESPHAYVTRCRMNLAQNLLRTSRRSVQQIARGAGYQSEAGFSRAFKRWAGTSPVAYRADVARRA